jgi:Protein of unknown function (DUF5818)
LEVLPVMKSAAIKRSLFVCISLVLAALTARRYIQETEIEADPAGPGDSGSDSGSLDHSGTPAPILGDQPGPILPRSPAMAAPTVTFSGTVVRSGPRFALRETAGALYPLDSAGRAWSFEGEDVRVTGKLDLDTRLLYVDAIEHAAL